MVSCHLNQIELSAGYNNYAKYCVMLATDVQITKEKNSFGKGLICKIKLLLSGSRQ